jgi:DNA-binding NtrC family response regulator
MLEREGVSMKALVVDDEQTVRNEVKKALEAEGISTVLASNGADAIGYLKREIFDLVILDVEMPGMGGEEILSWAQAEGLLSPIIALSESADVQDAVAIMRLGARDYFQKPLEIKRLVKSAKQLGAAYLKSELFEAGLRSVSVKSLKQSGFPGTTHEISSLLDRVVAYCKDNAASLGDGAAKSKNPHPVMRGKQADIDVVPLRDLEREAIIVALKKWEGNRTRASEELGISRRTIINKIKEYGLPQR